MTDLSAQTTLETELLAFRLGEQEYCLDIMSVREIRGWTRATPLPFAPDHMKGVINLRGAILPVIDLAVRLGMPPASGGERNVIIVVCINGRTAGLLVDSVSDILSIARGELQPPPDLGGDGAGMCISALTLVDERLIRVLDLGAVLPVQTADAA
ncbi:chemotaxis protein CheW [Paracoccus sp. Z118]|uniref:chemotaxis protein CheW n=1 Tax=Paracoccus sp. Z118 TaxID=2851017 RepID=UPI001C2B7B03|nr:chemotaxis protein CheW [Paracoccus sp. Z118]MBV0892507.1 chemotaxis protein CheW [Paracoccus sp. Z118]